jgi:Domain of unknown function (DUF4386)
MTGKRWQTAGGVMGLLFVGLTLATLFLPDTPELSRPTSEIVRSLADDRSALILGFYLTGLAFVLFLGFAAALSSRLREAEPEAGASVLALLGGAAIFAGVLFEETVYLAVVNAAHQGREPASIRALYELAETVLVPLRFAVAAFLAGVALSALATKALPRWLAWAAALFAAFSLLGLLNVFGEDPEEGTFDAFLIFGRLGFLLWTLAASIVLLRTSRREPHAVTAERQWS